MRSGAYTTPIEILRKNIVTTDYGTDKLTWETVWKTRADVKWLSGTRTEENREIFYSEQVKFTVRYYIDVQLEDRIMCKGKQYRILSIQDETDTTHNHKTITSELINE